MVLDFGRMKSRALVICCRMKRLRSDFVGSIEKLMRSRFVTVLAAESTISLPGIPLWLWTQMQVTDWTSDEQVVRRVCISGAGR